MTGKFKVYEDEIPSQITINLSSMEKAVFARLLTKFGFGVDVAGDTFRHLYKKGLFKVYNEYETEEHEKIHGY